MQCRVQYVKALLRWDNEICPVINGMKLALNIDFNIKPPQKNYMAIWVEWKKKNILWILTQLTRVVDFELKTQHTKFYASSVKQSGVVGPKSCFRHLHPLKIKQNPDDHRAKKMRFVILRLSSAFLVRFEITFVGVERL